MALTRDRVPLFALSLLVLCALLVVYHYPSDSVERVHAYGHEADVLVSQSAPVPAPAPKATAKAGVKKAATSEPAAEPAKAEGTNKEEPKAEGEKKEGSGKGEGGEEEPSKDMEEKESNARLFIILVIVSISLTFEYGIGSLRSFLQSRKEDGRSLLQILDGLFRELAILGFISVLLFMSVKLGYAGRLSRSLFHENELLAEMAEKMHMLLFLVMLLFIGMVLFLLFLARRVSHQWHDAENRTAIDIAKEYAQLSTAVATTSAEKSRLAEVEYQLDYHIIRHEFINPRSRHQQKLKPSFNMADYLTRCMGEVFEEIVEVPLKTWLFLIVVACVCRSLEELPSSVIFGIQVGQAWVLACFLYLIQRKCAWIRLQLLPPHRAQRTGSPPHASSYGAAAAPTIASVEKDTFLRYTFGRPTFLDQRLGNRTGLAALVLGSGPASKHSSLFWFYELGPGFLLRAIQVVLLLAAVTIGGAITFEGSTLPWWCFVLMILGVLVMLVLVFPDTMRLYCLVTHVEQLRKRDIIEETENAQTLRKEELRMSVVQWCRAQVRAEGRPKQERDITEVTSPPKSEGTALTPTPIDANREEMEIFREIFDLYDNDHSGSISKDELDLTAMCNTMGLQLSKSEIAEIESMVHGDLDLQHFVDLLEYVAQEIERRHKAKAGIARDEEDLSKEYNILHRAFKKFDKDGDGQISTAEFTEAFHGDEFGADVSANEIKELLQDLDTDGSGEVGAEEFIAWLQKPSNL